MRPTRPPPTITAGATAAEVEEGEAVVASDDMAAQTLSLGENLLEEYRRRRTGEEAEKAGEVAVAAMGTGDVKWRGGQMIYGVM